MASLSSFPALAWSAVCDNGFAHSQPAPPEPPQQLYFASSGFPSYNLSIVNNSRHADVVKGDSSFFNKGYCDHSGSGNGVLPDDDYGCLPSFPDYAYCFSNGEYGDYALDELLNPVPDYLTAPVTDPLSLPGFYDINYNHFAQQQVTCEAGLIGQSNYTGIDEQFYYDQAPAFLPSKRHRQCHCDAVGGLVSDNDPFPLAQLPGLPAIDAIANKLDEDVLLLEQPQPKQRRVSAQSLAARERRRRITDKTQELGKLIPGGTKMNTAEMLETAYKYVKFLQSQIQIFELMPVSEPIQENDQVEKPNMKGDVNEKGKRMWPNPLQMVASSIVQEKLCKEGSCIVPRSLVESLAISYPHLRDLQQLL